MTSTRRALAFCFTLNLCLVAVAVILGVTRSANGNPSRYFGEGRWTTLVSCLQLLIVAFFAFRVFLCRGAVTSDRGPRLWLLIAVGFVFLAADDGFQIHEQIDSIIHRRLHWKSTALTDRIDDAIIALYGLIGLVVLWVYRRELLQFRPMLKALGVGGVCAVLSILCDTLSNRPDFFFWLTGNMDRAKKLEGWFAVGDGGFQLLAIGSFVAAFYLAWAQARMGGSATTPATTPGAV
jgi:hypothetical protein